MAIISGGSGGGLAAPAWSAWVPGFTGFSVNPTVSQARYATVGKLCFLYYWESVVGTSNATSFTITGVPVTAAATNPPLMCIVTDNGITQTSPGYCIPSGTTLTFAKGLGGAGFTAAGGKGAQLFVVFEIA